MDISDLRGEDVIIRLCARETCSAGKQVKFYAKDERRHYAFHYIMLGKGVLNFGGKDIPLKTGDLFLIPPMLDVSYSTTEPWEYYWVEVEGKLAPYLFQSLGFTNKSLKVGYKQDSRLAERFNDLITYYYNYGDAELRAKGVFYLLIGELNAVLTHAATGTEKRNVDFYVREAETYLKYNLYYTGVTLDSLAKSISVNKNYLCTIFRQQKGVSPMQYLIHLRMEAAAKRFRETTESVTAVARYVGYKDPLHFSKAFRAYYGVSPTQYREELDKPTD